MTAAKMAKDAAVVAYRLREWIRKDQLPVFRDTLPDADKIGQPTTLGLTPCCSP